MDLTFIGPCMVILFLYLNQLDTLVYQIYLFYNDTVHVSDGLSVHHQEFKTVHRATNTAVCLLAAAC